MEATKPQEETPEKKKGAAKRLFSRLTSWLYKTSVPVLWGLILLGVACRFYGVNWDEGTTLHPDERFCVSIVDQLRAPSSLHDYFDSRVSPLNPANLRGAPHYVYGQLPTFIGAMIGKVLGRTEGAKFLPLGRILSAIFDCGTILMTWLIARRLLSQRAALLAAALVAGAALHIQQSHFFVVDPFAAFFLTASFWAGTRLVQENRTSDAIWCGVFFGAALACKISTALFGVALLVFLVLFGRRNSIRRTLIAGSLGALTSLVVFRVGHPMAFRGEFPGLLGLFDIRPEARFLRDVQEQAGITSGIGDVPFNVQWIGRTDWWFSLWNLGFWGYSWLFLISAALGAMFLLAKPRGKGVLVAGTLFALVLFGIQGATFSKFSRYYLPLTPFCALLAAHLWRTLSAKRAGWSWGGAVTVLSVAVWGFSVTTIYSRPHTRLAASKWINENLEDGTFVANETSWDEGLPISWYQATESKHPFLNTLVLETYDFDTDSKRETLCQNLDRVQWIFLSSGRSWQNIPRWPAKWPVMSEFYRALFEGKLGFHLEKSFTSFPTFGPFTFPDGNAEEALNVYDHPIVLLFKKDESYDAVNVRRILEGVELPQGQHWEPRLAPKPDEAKLPVPVGF